MKSILLTGGTGFIGKNILEQLGQKYKIFAPKRSELNIINQESVKKYLVNKNFDVVVHCAILNPNNNEEDKNADILDYTMRGLLNLKLFEKNFEKIIYIGSGAEFDKSKDIVDVNEYDVISSIPTDAYGYGKYILNQIAQSSTNIYNLRIFGCYGKYEQEKRLIRSVINDCLHAEKIYLKQNCYFSYVLVDDLIKTIDWAINNSPLYHSYNICNKEKYSLLDIANLIKSILNSKKQIIIKESGLNKEYTGNSSKIFNEINFEYCSIEDGIKKEIDWIRGNL